MKLSLEFKGLNKKKFDRHIGKETQFEVSDELRAEIHKDVEQSIIKTGLIRTKELLNSIDSTIKQVSNDTILEVLAKAEHARYHRKTFLDPVSAYYRQNGARIIQKKLQKFLK